MKQSRWRIFRDDNEWNEKTIIGFISFAIMVIYAFIHLIGQFFGWTLEINEYIYTSFVTVTLGSFGIAEISKTAKEWGESRQYNPPEEREHDTNETPEEVDDYQNHEG